MHLATPILLAVLAASAPAADKKLAPKELPAAVLSAFQKAFPKAQIKGAALEEKDGRTCFEIESRDGSTERDLLYAADGTLVEVEETIPVEALPAAVKAGLAASYPGAKLKKAEQATAGGVVTYAVKLKTAQGKKTVDLDASGKVLKEEKPEDRK